MEKIFSGRKEKLEVKIEKLGSTRAFLTGLLFLLASCTSTEAPKDFQDAFNQGPCKFGRIHALKDPELPHTGFLPTVYCQGERPPLFTLAKEWMDYNWTEVYFDGNDRYVAILDWAIEGGFEKVPVLESKDRGKTWAVISQVEKPHFSARVTKLVFDAQGNGTLQMEWELKAIQIVSYSSQDNGRSWRLNKASR